MVPAQVLSGHLAKYTSSRYQVYKLNCNIILPCIGLSSVSVHSIVIWQYFLLPAWGKDLINKPCVYFLQTVLNNNILLQVYKYGC